MTVLESLFVGVFGMSVVFLVLVGLCLLVRLQSALINRFTLKKKAETPEGTPAGIPAWDEIEHEAPSLISVAETHYTEALDEEMHMIVSPAPGTVLDVKACAGKQVKSGELLLLLDAMNMEYEISATSDGTVAQIFVSRGAAVEVGTPLIEIQ